jgi:hypothetical protein
MGLYEGTQEVLVASHYHCADVPRNPDRLDARVRGGAVYLYFILEVRPGIAQIEIVTNAG